MTKRILLLLIIGIGIISSKNTECAEKRKPTDELLEEHAAPKKHRVAGQRAEQERKEEMHIQAEEKTLSAQQAEEQLQDLAQSFLPPELTAVVDEYAAAGEFIPGSVTLYHPAPVLAVSFSPDGTKMATASEDWIVRIWDANTGQELLQLLTGHSNAVTSIAFSYSGTKVITGSADGAVRIFDAHSGKLLQTLPGCGLKIKSVAFGPNDTKIAVGSISSSFPGYIFDTKIDKLIPLVPPSDIQSVAFNFDGTKVLTGSFDHVARIWDATTGRLLQTFTEQTSNKPLQSVIFRPHSAQIIAVDFLDNAYIWDSNNGKLLQRLPDAQDAHILRDNKPGYSIACSPDGTQFVTGGNKNTAYVWDITTGKLLQQLTVLTNEPRFVHSVAFSPDGNRIATASTDKTVRIWDKTPRLTRSKPAKKIKDKQVAQAKFFEDLISLEERELLLQQHKKIRDRLDLAELVSPMTIKQLDVKIQKLEQAKVIRRLEFNYVRKQLNELENTIEKLATLRQEIQDISQHYADVLLPAQSNYLADRLTALKYAPFNQLAEIQKGVKGTDARFRRIKDITLYFPLPEDQERRFLLLEYINKLIQGGKTDQEIIKQLKMQKN